MVNRVNEVTKMREPNVIDDLPAIPRAVTPMQMLQIAIERGADIAMLERLMDLQQRWEAGEARKAYTVAMTEFKRAVPELLKNKQVAYGNTRYAHATLDNVVDVLVPALAQFGFSHAWAVEQGDHDVITVSCVITHSLGHAERVSLSAKPDTSGQKNAIQAIGSAISYLERYSLLSATGLAAREQDDDGRASGNGHTNGNGKISAEQKETLIGLIKETGSDTKRCLDYLGVRNLDELSASKFAVAKAALERKKSAKKEPA
jgi:hypothetical protein